MSEGLRIYLSGPQPAAQGVNECATELTDAGHEILSTWHVPGSGWAGVGSAIELVPVLLRSVQAIVQADLLVAFIQGGDRGRSLFETGVATHAGLHIHLIGRPDPRGYDLLPTTTRWQSWGHFRRGSLLWPVPQ